MKNKTRMFDFHCPSCKNLCFNLVISEKSIKKKSWKISKFLNVCKQCGYKITDKDLKIKNRKEIKIPVAKIEAALQIHNRRGGD